MNNDCVYAALVERGRPGDATIVVGIDRLGRNAAEVTAVAMCAGAPYVETYRRRMVRACQQPRFGKLSDIGWTQRQL